MMITLVKLGGSLITDKLVRNAFRRAEMARIAREIADALTNAPNLRLIVGHGSGSFGHFEAKQHGTMQGVHTPEQWRGFASVATVAAELNFLVAQELVTAGVAVFRMQPSASAQAEDGIIQSMALSPIQQAVERGIVPLVYGDVAFDSVRGGTIISTETVFTYLAQQLPVTRILLLGEVDGVYDDAQRIIPLITSANFSAIQPMLGGSGGVDVTGGMLTKVEDMLALVAANATMQIRIINGKTPDLLRDTLLDKHQPGTLIQHQP
jgi:isopentenyl phosphate kinase